MKTLSYIFISYFVVTIYSANAQYFNVINQRVYGTYAGNEVRGMDTVNNKTILAIGTTANSIDNDKTCFIGNTDAWVVCFDKNLNEVWQKCYGGMAIDYINDVSISYNNEILIAISSSSGISGNKTLPSFGGQDYWFVKTDASGTILNQFVYGGSGVETFSKIILLDDGYLLCGTSDSPISGNKTSPNRGNSDYWILKVDVNGNISWDNVYGGTGYDGLNGATLIPGTDKVILYGVSNSPISFEKTEPSYGFNDYWLVLIDTSGNKIWDKTIGTLESEFLCQVVFFQNNLFLLASTTSPTASGTQTCNIDGYSDLWITKIDLNGNILWDKCMGGDAGDGFRSASVHDNKIWLGCSSGSNISGIKTENCCGMSDYWFLAIDSSANVLYQKTVGGTNFDGLHTLHFTSSNSILLAGSSLSPVSCEKSIPPFGTEDLWFVHAGLSVGLNEVELGVDYNIYPNPATDLIHIQNENGSLRKVEMFDVTGRLVLEEMYLSNQTSIELNISMLKSGYYLIKLTDSKHVVTVRNVIKQ